MSYLKEKRKNIPNILDVFFRDVAQIPIVAGKEDYLPLIRRIRRGVMLRELLGDDPECTFTHIFQKQQAVVQKLDQICMRFGTSSLNIYELSLEIESFFDNPRERMPRTFANLFCNHIQQTEDEQQLEDTICNCLYLTSLLPPTIWATMSPLTFNPEVSHHFEQILRELNHSKTRLVEGTLRYAISIARLYVGNGIPYLDLVQEGILGLMHATENFDENRNAHFQHYAGDWIRQRITRHIADNSRLIRIPVHTQEDFKQIETVYQEFIDQRAQTPSFYDIFKKLNWLTEEDFQHYQQHKHFIKLLAKFNHYKELLDYLDKDIWYIPLNLQSTVQELQNRYDWLKENSGRTPSPEQVFIAMGWFTNDDIKLLSLYQSDSAIVKSQTEAFNKFGKAVEKLNRFQIANAKHYSPDDTKLSHPETNYLSEISEWIVSEESTEGSVHKILLAEAANQALGTLDERNRTILRLRLGLEDSSPKTLDELGTMMGGLTRERVRQIEAKSLRQLRHPKRATRLKPFFETESDHFAISNFYSGKLLCLLNNYEQANDDNYDAQQERKHIEKFIQKYIRGGRRKVWDTRRQNGRVELLREALTVLNTPSHYSVIHEKAIQLVPDGLQFTKSQTYSTLFYRADSFRSLGNAVFGLTTWKNEVLEIHEEQVFQHCPSPLLPQNAQASAFFESIIVGRELLKRAVYTGQQFWRAMLSWAKREHLSVQDAQSAFDTWYAAGLIERLDFIANSNSNLTVTLPDAKLNEIRHYSLNSLCRRIVKMPELLLTLDRIARPTVPLIQKVVFGGEREGFDVSTRLTILASFEAIVSEGSEWRLTDLGRSVLETNLPQELPEFTEIDAYLENDQVAPQMQWDEDLGLLDI